jgi:hypothetical protein
MMLNGMIAKRLVEKAKFEDFLPHIRRFAAGNATSFLA